MVVRFNMNRFLGHMNPLWIMAATIGFEINPHLLMGKHYKTDVMEDLRKYYAVTYQHKTYKQLEKLFNVKFCAIKYKDNSGFQPDDFYFISRRAVFYEFDVDNLWFYWIDASCLLPTLTKKLKKDIRCPSDYWSDILFLLLFIFLALKLNQSRHSLVSLDLNSCAFEISKNLKSHCKKILRFINWMLHQILWFSENVRVNTRMILFAS